MEVRSFLNCWKDRKQSLGYLPVNPEAQESKGMFQENAGFTYPKEALPLPELAISCSYLWDIMVSPSFPPFRSHVRLLLLPDNPPLPKFCFMEKLLWNSCPDSDTIKESLGKSVHLSESLISQFWNGLNDTWSQQRRCWDGVYNV